MSISLLTSVVAGVMLTAPQAARAEVFYPSASWDVAEIGVNLIANVDSDLLARPQARLTLAWDSASPGQGTLCVAYSIDGGAAVKTLAMSSVAETRTSDSIVQVGTTTGRTLTTVHTWTELVSEYELDPSVSHTLTVLVLDEQCPGDVPAGGGNEPFSIAELVIPAAEPDAQQVALDLATSLTEDPGNSTLGPDQTIGDAPTGDNWIHPGESADFGKVQTRLFDRLWDGPLVLADGTEVSGTCEVFFVNLDDVVASPDPANSARGYDLIYSGVTFGAAVTRESGSADKSHSDPRVLSSTTSFSWSTLIADGYRGWTFDPTKINSITRMIFPGSCWDGAYVASGSSTNSTAPVNPAVNYASSLRHLSRFDSVLHFYRWDYWAHPVSGRSNDDFYATRATALASETLYLGPADLGVEFSETEIGVGGSVDLDATWFDGSSCIGVYVDDELVSRAAAGTVGTPGGFTASTFTWAELMAAYSLDTSTQHTVTYAIFAGPCSDLAADEPLANASDSTTVTLKPVVPSAAFVAPTVQRGDTVDLDLEWANPQQCVAIFLDGEFLESFASGGTSKTYGSSSTAFSWDAMMAEHNLDWSVAHDVIVRLYDRTDAGCSSGETVFSFDELTDPSTHETTLRLQPVLPDLETSAPKVGPGESADITVDRDTHGDLAAAQYIDGVFVGCVPVSDLPAAFGWDDLDVSYDRDAEHTVTFAIYPIAAGVSCDEDSIAGLTALVSVDVVLTPTVAGPGGLAATGADHLVVSVVAAAWFVALGAALLLIRRRRTAA